MPMSMPTLSYIPPAQGNTMQPRFFQKEMENDIDNIINEHAEQYVNSMLNQTITRLNILKEELNYLRNDDNHHMKQVYINQYKSFFSRANNTIVTYDSNIDKQDKSDSLNNIVNRYSMNTLGDQFQLFNDAFRFANTTRAGVNRIDLEDLNEKIINTIAKTTVK
jgi:hypothetical protein